MRNKLVSSLGRSVRVPVTKKFIDNFTFKKAFYLFTGYNYKEGSINNKTLLRRVENLGSGKFQSTGIRKDFKKFYKNLCINRFYKWYWMTLDSPADMLYYSNSLKGEDIYCWDCINRLDSNLRDFNVWADNGVLFPLFDKVKSDYSFILGVDGSPEYYIYFNSEKLFKDFKESFTENLMDMYSYDPPKIFKSKAKTLREWRKERPEPSRPSPTLYKFKKLLSGIDSSLLDVEFKFLNKIGIDTTDRLNVCLKNSVLGDVSSYDELLESFIKFLVDVTVINPIDEKLGGIISGVFYGDTANTSWKNIKCRWLYKVKGFEYVSRKDNYEIVKDVNPILDMDISIKDWSFRFTIFDCTGDKIKTFESKEIPLSFTINVDKIKEYINKGICVGSKVLKEDSYLIIPNIDDWLDRCREELRIVFSKIDLKEYKSEEIFINTKEDAFKEALNR